MKDYISRAQKNFRERRKQEGWIGFACFVPKEIKQQLLELKRKLIKEWYDKHQKNN